jgi:ABC-type transport system involved in multi-copper enzyme maturation permease subunit
VLPIVQRELQAAARSPKLYRGRFLSWVAMFFLVCLIVPRSAVSPQGGQAFQSLTTLALLICLIEGIRKTADSISSERREGTLGLLFLSTLSGWDIILGKLTSAAIRSVSTLLVFLPVLAVTLLLGGTTGGEFWRSFLILLLALFASLCLCLCLSCVSTNGAVTLSLVVLAALCTVPMFSVFNNAAAQWVLPLNPFWALRAASDSSYSMDHWLYWRSLIYFSILIFVSLGIASFVLPHAWQDRPFTPRKSSRLSGPLSPSLLAYRRAMLDHNPIMWLFFNPRSHRNFRSIVASLLVLAVLGTATVVFISRSVYGEGFEFIFPLVALVLLVLASCLRVARATSYNFYEARSNGALELILSTPLKVHHIISGQWLALRADLKPALILFIILGSVVLLLATASNDPGPIVFTMKILAEAVLAVMTTATVGVWMGLKQKTAGRAHFWTIALGMLAPFLICTPTIVNQVVFIVVAADKLNANFRRFVAERYLPSGTLAPVPPTTSKAPPVLR